MSLAEFEKELRRRKLRDKSIEDYMMSLGLLERFLGSPLGKDTTKKDIERYLDSISSLSVNSIRTKLSAIKVYFKWLYNTKKGYPEVADFTLPKDKGNGLIATDLITEEEIIRMVNACDNLRDKALISVLYDSACRRGEVINLNIEDVVLESDRTGYIVVDGKTGRRQVPLSFSIPSLKEWINSHPCKDKPGNPLFCSLVSHHDNRFNRQSVRHSVDKACKRAGIKKRIFLHLFRHSRLTDLDRKGLSHTAMKHYAGWTRKSNMPAVYSHFSAQDTKDLIYQADGLAKPKVKKTILEPVICVKCDTPNDKTNRFCYLCGNPLDEESMKEYEISELLKRLIKSDPSLSKILAEKIKQLKS